MKKFFKKIGKGIKKGVKKIGKALKTGMKSVSKALGPVGTLALSLMLPGIGAAWAGFTGAAATATGAMGTVMRGIAAAGNAVGTVYSSVTGMLGSVVKAIPGVGDMYTKLSNFTGEMMDRGRMALGLPTSGATTAANTAAVGNEMSVELEPMKVDTTKLQKKNLLDIDTNFKVEMKDPGGTFFEGGELGSVPVDYNVPTGEKMTVGGVQTDVVTSTAQPLKTKMANFKQEDWDALGIDKNVNRDFTDMEMAKINDYQPTNVVQSKPLEYTKDLTPMSQYTPDSKFIVKAGKASPAEVMSTEDFLDKEALQDPNGFTKVRSNIKVDSRTIGDGVEIDDVSFETYDVRTKDLTSDQLKQINRTNREIDYFNNQRDRILGAATLEDGTINPEFNQLDKNMVGLKRGAKLAAGAEALVNTAMEEEPVGGGGGGDVPVLTYNMESATDYSQAYASAFQGAGYVGPNDFTSYANAGFYGGDPFSIAQYNKVRAPQPTVRLGG